MAKINFAWMFFCVAFGGEANTCYVGTLSGIKCHLKTGFHLALVPPEYQCGTELYVHE